VRERGTKPLFLCVLKGKEIKNQNLIIIIKIEILQEEAKKKLFSLQSLHQNQRDQAK
jgi:hypothetical protein